MLLTEKAFLKKWKKKHSRCPIWKIKIEPVDFEKALDSFTQSSKALTKNP